MLSRLGLSCAAKLRETGYRKTKTAMEGPVASWIRDGQIGLKREVTDDDEIFTF
jgi:hypothetical protein